VPGGVADPAALRSDIQDMAAHGIGGAEYNHLVLAQGYNAAQYGFGTPAWTDNAKAALRAGRDFGVQIDFIVAPGWSAGSPLVTPDTAGSAKTLVNGNATVADGATFSGALPRPTAALPSGATKRELIAALAVRCATVCTGTAPIQLDRATAVDLTDQVVNGELTWTAPAGGEWKLFGFYYQGNGTRPVGINPTSPNSFVVDHFSAAGTQALTRMWDEKVLDTEMRELLRAGGGSMFVDSLELGNQNWTPELPAEFRARRGYSLVAALPVLTVSGSPAFEYAAGVGARYRSDWKKTLNELWLAKHLDPLRAWTNALGMKLRYQTYSSSGATVIDPIESFTHVDGPEGEDWVYNGVSQTTLVTKGADSFRATAAAAAISGKPIVSDECCAGITAFSNDSYRVTWQQMLGHINQNLATGVNRVVYHGFSNRKGSPLLQYFIGTPGWPGWSPFVPVTGIGENWDSRQPAWDDQTKINRYLGRMQTVLREGALKSDVAIYRQGTELGSVFWADQSLARAGYTYGFLSAPLVESATVGGGRLAPDGPAYGALVLDNQTALPLATAQRILADARAGLTVVIVGAKPSQVPGASGEDAALQAVIADLVADPHVVQVADQAAVPAALRVRGVRPAAEFDAPLITVRRSTADTEYYYVFNSSTEATEASLALTGEGAPLALDAWSGAVTPIARYTRSSGRVGVRVSLPPTGATVVALSKTAGGSVFATSTTADEVLARGNGLTVRASAPGTYTTTLSDGRTASTAIADVPAPIALPDWTLGVESWGPGATPDTDAKIQLAPIPLTAGSDGRLPAWTSIAGLESASGIGTYTTTVELPAAWTGGHGAYLDLGSVFNTFSVTINGQALPPVDQMNPNRLDVGPYLRAGSNTITVREATTLRNRILTVAGQAGGSGTAKQDYGLRGPVRLIPYGEAAAFASTSTGGSVGGSVPATLSLTLGAPASFGPFTPGMDRTYETSTTATVTSTAGDATLSTDGGRLSNGTFTLSEPLQVAFSKSTWNAPASNDVVTIAFKQHIGATEPLRTGAYSKTLTFTLSTTTP
jgi:hypothetical protein